MHLRSITLKGFKSFPDRTRLEFAPGVSVIVGPNGSGKSNITDAVLWALGEQSPLAVRGQSMQDVIFAGARGQQGRRAAEVELVIDDGKRELGSEFTELSIVRRLERSGEGEYRINGARCRLIDVIEVLSDTGLGKEMHSVVSQGRVEAVISSKPRDRRLLIEEAAGLGKHRKRRRRAQLKLARTQDNLDRALDVEREARSRLRPLKRQAEAAELHARLERQTLEARWELARDAARARAASLAEAEHAAAEARDRREQIDRALTEVAARREGAEQALAGRAEQREELTRRLFDARAAGERVALRGDHARAAADAADERAGAARQRLAVLEADASDDEADAEDRGRIAELEAELARLDAELHAALEEQLAPLEREREDVARAAAAAQARVESLRGELAAAEERCEAERSARAAAERAAEAARSEAARVAAELSAAEQFLRSRAEAHGGGDERALADQLDVDPGYEAALAAALGGRLGAAVVADLAAGAKVLDRTGGDGGSALVTGAAPTPDAGADPPLPEAERLIDHVRGGEPLMSLVRSLLADTWVVSELASLSDRFVGTAVTRGGRAWLGASRELRQIAEGGEERVLAERNRRDQLAAAHDAAAAAQRQTTNALERAVAAVGAADAQRDYADRALRTAARERDETAERERRAEWLIEQRRSAPDEGPTALRRAQVEGALAAERRVADRAERARRDRVAEIDAQRRALSRDETLSPAARELAAALGEVAAELAARATQLEAELASDRAGGEEVAAELRSCAQREAELQAKLREHGDAVTAAEVAAQQARDQAAEVDAELAQLALRLELESEPAERPLDDDERASLEQRIERLARRREQLGPVNPLAKDEYAEAREYVEGLERQRHDLEAALRELEGLIAETDRRIREAFETTFAAAARNFEEVVEQLFPGGRGQLRLVHEDAGPRPVLGGQALNGDGEGTEPEEGDDAAAPEPEEDRLGIEIEMTPAGKAMKRLSLLSGGEKSLTALAFLFAVFLARPCPFYVLDEVEAALDDLNIDRFLTLLRRYSERAQFIVVTHQKRTMEAADTLYGVSMGDDGVSKVISRRLPRDDTVDAAAPAA